MLRRIYKFYRQHFYAINGALIGLIIGFSFVKLDSSDAFYRPLCDRWFSAWKAAAEGQNVPEKSFG